MSLLRRIRAREARVGVIGLGYVGLPLALAFCRAGFRVTGFDVDEEKVRRLARGESYIRHVPSDRISACGDRFTPTADFARLAEVDCILVCVPTPLTRHREPDMTYVFGTARTVARHLRKGQLVVLESTTYPGTTDEDLRAILEESGLRAGRDFHLAYSPEREDPNNPDYSTTDIPKVVGGLTPGCLRAARALYDCVVVRTVPVSSTRAAEAAKLLENIYRAVNIALVNELKVLFDRMGIDVWEVIEAAKTKPFGFQAFYPGPGLGGHCIPIDPFYLSWKAREYDLSTRFIELAGEVNTRMPYHVVEKTVAALNARGKSIKGARILILGLAYKRDVDDIRESPSLKLIELFQDRGARVAYSDPYVPRTHRMRRYDFRMRSVPLTPANLKRHDCVVVATDHSSVDYRMVAEHAALVIDTRNVVPGAGRRKNIVKA
ncbi:nucleotide sugar dehydrogenase [Dissulfurirhabdus thermomarina]|uniref:Nucleotide sugar dehydrogenase n=1 Tax=Dissulfurirhabdus thermomarina TaxID=1765737 RepID=A0A6N9TKS3_DISTH|nr:nucleotide sugar dehydrogenase [Dissulfurirhabdus thermomarina]NDY41872.1 nucleotide sugar dehydrogenase [Dissulfurirhabdus thermomarina]NMX22573.1 nucleotide sugar dehydrogenase [Dissulfurirhabdus thermomarina]